MAIDPYAAPRARVADRPETADGTFLPDGQAVAAIEGWNWIVEGWRLFARQPLTWVLLTLVFGLVMFAMAIVPILGALGLLVLFPVFAAGFLLACRDLERGAAIRIGHLFAGFQHQPGRLAALGALGLAAFVVLGLAVAAMFWSTFAGLGRIGGDSAAMMAAMGQLVLAGLVVLALSVPIYMAFWFAPALVALNDFAPGDALKASFRACLRNVLPFLLYGAVMFVLSVLAGLIYIGWIVLGPVLAASVYAAYRGIFYAR
jgi:uncharacterized membrane protein